MSAVFSSFTIIGIVIVIGYITGRTRILGEGADVALSRLVFFVATPALLIDSLATAPLSSIFSVTLFVSAASALILAGLYYTVARRFLRRPIPEATIGALSSSYVNSANLGIPIAVFLLGDASYVAPLLLVQILMYTPIALTLLDVTVLGTGRPTFWRTLASPFKNPIVIGGLIGLALAITKFTLPGPIAQPFHLIAGCAVPGALLAFGISLHGVKVLQRGKSPRRDVALASLLKVIVHPLVAFALAAWIFRLHGHELFAAVVLAALPTAQNVFVYASTYQRGTLLARDTALVTTMASIPVLLIVSALLK